VAKVSVVLNCYNHEAYVAEAVESVLAQTFSDFELILIDNGSTDGTRAVLERYSDPRIRRFFHDINESLSRRLNQGVVAAIGDYVCILYSDDWMLPDKLEQQVARIRELPTDYGVVYSPSEGFNQRTGVRWKNSYLAVDGAFMPAILRRCTEGFPDISSPMYRRACFDGCPWHEDLFSDGEAIQLRIGLAWKFRYFPEPTVVLRDHGGNMGKAIQKNHDNLMTVCERMRCDPSFPLAMKVDLDHFCAVYSRSSAWVALRVGSRDTGWIWRQLGAVWRFDWTSAIHSRFVAGCLFALAPYALRQQLNWLGRKLRGTNENAVLVSEY
jgi:glycosyltransferase involved in cell wall biosynthesis